MLTHVLVVRLNTGLIDSRICLAWKSFAGTKKRRYTGQRPGTERASRPTYKPLVDRGFCFPHRFKWDFRVRASEGPFKILVFDALRGKRVDFLLGGPSRRRPVLRRPSPKAALPCGAPPRPARAMSGFGRLGIYTWSPEESSGLIFMIFPDMTCMKKVYIDKQASVHFPAARNVLAKGRSRKFSTIL